MKKIKEGAVILIFIFGIMLTGLVLGEATTSVTQTTDNTQYTQPSPFDYYAGNALTKDLWPSIVAEQCDQRNDFSIEIDTLGCTPTVVRSDLLEEQNVAVFCRLKGTKINPLIEVPKINSISVKNAGDMKYISGIGFHPARAALSAGSTLGNSPMMDNLGYAVIVLKQQINESSMPDWVDINLTAQIAYSLQNTFGAGESSFILKQLNEVGWQSTYSEYSFWQGKGYIRLEDIQQVGDIESAKLSIYKDKENKLATFLLKEGQTSADVFLQGFYCSAGLNARVNKIDFPVKRAKLNINGNDLWVIEGSDVLGKCKVESIEQPFYNSGYVRLNCYGDIYELKYNPAQANILAKDMSDNEKQLLDSSFEVGRKVINNVYVIYSGTSNEQQYIVLANSDSSMITDKSIIYLLNKKISSLLASGLSEQELNKKEDEIKNYLQSLLGQPNVQGTNNAIKILSKTRAASFSVKETSSGKTVDKVYGFIFKGIKGPEDRIYPINEEDKIGKLLLDYYNLAQDAYSKVYNSYPYEKESISNENYGAIALWKAVQLAKGVEKFKTYQGYLEELVTKFPNSNYAKQAKAELTKINSDIDLSKASTIASGSYGTFAVSLDSVEEPTQDEANVELIVNGERKILAVNGAVDSSERVSITSFSDSSVNFNYNYLNDKGEIVSGGSFSLREKETKTLQTNMKSPDEKTTIVVSKINLKKIAYVSIIPKQNSGYQETNFKFKIAIEKRAIKLSPEKTKEMIASLNASIAKWEKINANLASMVKTMKTACLATSMMLWTKNLFANMKGGNQGRTEVMKVWKTYCAENVGYGKKYQTSHQCYLENSKVIDSDSSVVESLLKTTDSCVAKIQVSAKTIQTNEKLSLEEAYSKAASQESCASYSTVLQKENKNNINTADLLKRYPDLAKQGVIFSSDIDESIKQLQLLKACNEGRLQTIFCETEKAKAYDFFSKFDAIPSVKTVSADFSQTTGLPAPLTYAIGGTNPDKLLVQKSRVEISGKLVAGDSFAYYNLDGVGLVIFKLNPVAANSNTYQLVEAYKVESNSLGDKVLPEKLPQNKVFQGFDVGKCQNTFKDADLRVKFFETAPYKGLPALLPIDEKGWYVKIEAPKVIGTQSTAKYDASGLMKSFYICNVGENGRIDWLDGDSGDDSICCRLYQEGQGLVSGTTLPGLSETETQNIVNKAKNCVKSAADQYGKKTIYSDCLKKELKAEVQPNIPAQECEDFMSPQDCHTLFNVCDPVMCPPSRCNLGGRYYVEDVIQTGIVGGLTLCLPNKQEGIAIPLCLSGINAGLENYVTILKSARDCLQESLDTGKSVGICDEIKSVYICEFFWREASPFFNLVIPKMLYSVSKVTGGGGEYVDVLGAWQKTLGSITYFKDFYAQNAFKAFKSRTLAEAGTDICRAFVSKKFDVSKIFDVLTEPESPVQYTAYFDEIPMTTATVPATSQYKVYYHIYAGKDEGAYYSVYLRTKPESSFYITLPTVQVASGYAQRGNYVDVAKDFTAPSGYQELCIRINTQEKCGFGKVSTDYGINKLTDEYLASQANQTVKSEEECISGTPSVQALANNPLNIESAVTGALQPTLYKQGITRVCSGDNPSSNVNPARWTPVGFCDSAKKIRCWLDTDSVKTAIVDLKLEQETLANAQSKLAEIGVAGSWTAEKSNTALLEADAAAKKALEELKAKLYTTTRTEKEVNFYSNALFDFDSAILTDKGKTEIITKLDNILTDLKSNSVIKIEGYASKEGLEDYNLELSQARADAVAAYILEKYRTTLESKKITLEPAGMGETDKFSVSKYGQAKVNAELTKIDKASSSDESKKIAAASTILSEDRRVVFKYGISVFDLKTDIDQQEFDASIKNIINPIILQYKDVIDNSYLNIYKARAWLGIGDLYAGITMLLYKNAPRAVAKLPTIPIAKEIAVKLASGYTLTTKAEQFTVKSLDKSIFTNADSTFYWVVFLQAEQGKARLNVWTTTKYDYAKNFVEKDDKTGMTHEVIGQVLSSGQEYKTKSGLTIKINSVDDKNLQVTYSASLAAAAAGIVTADVQSLTKLMQYADKNSVSGRQCNCGTECENYASLIIKYSNKNYYAAEADPLLVLAVMMQESSCTKTAISKDKNGNPVAYGLMQIYLKVHGLSPSTFNWQDPETNIKKGMEILKSGYSACNNDWSKALSRYYSGNCNYNKAEYSTPVMERYNALKTAAQTNGWTASGTSSSSTAGTGSGTPTGTSGTTAKTTITFSGLGEYIFTQGNKKYFAENTGSYPIDQVGNYWMINYYKIGYTGADFTICYAKNPQNIYSSSTSIAGKVACKNGNTGTNPNLISGLKLTDKSSTFAIPFTDYKVKTLIERTTSSALPKL